LFRLVVPVTVVYRIEHRLALVQKQKCVQKLLVFVNLFN
jgi:hypothetical protein